MQDKYREIFQYREEIHGPDRDQWQEAVKDNLMNDENGEFCPFQTGNIQQAIADRPEDDAQLLTLSLYLKTGELRTTGLSLSATIEAYWSNEIDKMFDKYN